MPHAKRARIALIWEPLWDWPPVDPKDYSPRRWAGKFIKFNRWRCDRIYSEQDLMQEAYLVFMRISEKYPRVVSVKDFMKLYKRALSNWFNDRSLDVIKGRRGTLDVRNDDPTELLSHMSECPVDGINILLSEAPHELRLALALLVEQPDAIKMAAPGEKRENLNMKLRRILGLDEKFDLRAALTELLFN